MKRSRLRSLCLLVTGALLSVSVAVIGQQPAWALDSLPCDETTGPTAADAALAQQLNKLPADDMRGYMDAYRTSCARVITHTVKNRGLPERAAVIAVTAAIETHLRNLNGGDLDSLGLYQPRSGWGSAANRMDAVWSTNRFLNEMLDLYPSTWQSKPIGDVWTSTSARSRSAIS